MVSSLQVFRPKLCMYFSTRTPIAYDGFQNQNLSTILQEDRMAWTLGAETAGNVGRFRQRYLDSGRPFETVKRKRNASETRKVVNLTYVNI